MVRLLPGTTFPSLADLPEEIRPVFEINADTDPIDQQWLEELEARDEAARSAVSRQVAAPAEVAPERAREIARLIEQIGLASRRRKGRRWLVAATAAIALVAFGYWTYEWNETRKAKNQARAALTEVLDDGTYFLGPSRSGEAVGTFSIDAHEVSWHQFEACQRRGPCDDRELGQLDLPVTSIDALDAEAFCDWVGRSLPTFAEWEAAIRGNSSRTWPWGEDAPTHALVHMDAEPDGIPQDVASVSGDVADAGRTQEGAAHLLGNVAEWDDHPRRVRQVALRLWANLAARRRRRRTVGGWRLVVGRPSQSRTTSPT